MVSGNDDQGFTLLELLLVVAIIGVVLTAGWNLFNLITAGTNSGNSLSTSAADTSTGLEQMSRVLMQSTGVASADPYDLTVWTQPTPGGNFVLHRFYLNASHERLLDDYQTWNSGRTLKLSEAELVLSYNSANISTGTVDVPLFQYFDASNQSISNMALVSGSARIIRATIVTDTGVGRAQDSRDILLRNGGS